MTKLDAIVSRHFTSFTESDQQIYQSLLKYSTDIQHLTIQELAHLSYTSKSSVLRFVQKLGFQGFSDFKYSIDWLTIDVARESSTFPLSQHITFLERSLQKETIEKAADLLKQANLVCLLSTGEDQTLQMKNFARFLLKKGIMCSQLKLNPNSEITKLVLDKLTSDQLLIVFSSSGNNPFLKKYLAPIIEKQVPIIAITAFAKSWLEETAQFTFSLQLSIKNEQLYPYTSGLCHLMINMLVEKMGLVG